jgi:hypothetical protein
LMPATVRRENEGEFIDPSISHRRISKKVDGYRGRMDRVIESEVFGERWSGSSCAGPVSIVLVLEETLIYLGLSAAL